MNPEWYSLAAAFLADYSDRLSSDCCNDWRWPKSWSREKRRHLATQIVIANSGRDYCELTVEEQEEIESYVKSEYGPPNWWVASFLGSCLKEFA